MNLHYGPLRDILETVILALIVFLLAREAIQNFQVEGTSMVPTLQNEDFVLVNKLAYRQLDIGPFDALVPGKHNGDFLFGPPQRGDVAVFHSPRDESRDFVKRVIGLPGETVQIRGGAVFVDGVPVNDSFLVSGPAAGSNGTTDVPPGHYFVLGDNRSASQDSRSFGPIPQRLIVGKVWVRWFPFDAISGGGSEDLEPAGAAQLPAAPAP